MLFVRVQIFDSISYLNKCLLLFLLSAFSFSSYGNNKCKQEFTNGTGSLILAKLSLRDSVKALLLRLDTKRELLKTKQAAKRGNVDAQAALGIMYLLGENIEQNKETSFYWLMQAAEQGHAMAQYYVGLLYKYGAGIKRDIKQAARWLKESSQQGNEIAQKAVLELQQ